MTREEFVAQLERGVGQSSTLPVTSAILRWTADQLKRGEPPWWKGVAKAWEKRRFVAWSEAFNLYLCALHFEALNDAQCELVPYFPSCGGTAEADPSPGLAKFLAAPPPSFFENLKTRERRAYNESMALLWTDPAVLYFQRKRGLPFYLVEVDAGAGLNLASDLVSKQKWFDSDLVAARIGLDPQPLDLFDIAQRRWLTAGIWPDHVDAIVKLDNAIEAVQQRAKKDGAFLQLVPCRSKDAAAFVAKNIPSDDPDVGLLIFNMGTTTRMPDADYAAYARSIGELLRSWGDRGLWVEAENVRGETYSTTLQLRAHRVIDGALKSFVMSSFDLVAHKRVFSEASATFLAVP
ncbi:MAG: DUF2332 family protein [Elusimicrobia bacterium]|nr:DUF2332 family protein [Elusimicrobiota bacterium]